MNILEFQNINFSYPGGVQALKNVSFTIQEGEFVALLGRNGSGKTTILQHIMNLLSPTQGTVLVAGESIKGKGPAYVSQTVGYVFQHPARQMFLPTVWEEIAYGPKQQGDSNEEAKKKAYQTLERIGILHLAESYPKALSRGEIQKVAIGIALALEPKVLILDEPTSGQDGKATQEICKLLNQIHKEGATILLITHDMELLAETANRSVVMKEGEKVFDGLTTELFENPACRDWGLTLPVWLEIAQQIPQLQQINMNKPHELVEKLIALKKGGNEK